MTKHNWIAASPTVGSYWIPAEIELERSALVWRGTDDPNALPTPSRKVAPDAKALDAFLRLRQASDEAILEYASGHGVLIVIAQPISGDGERQRWREPLSAWRHRSSLAHAIVNVANTSSRERVPSHSSWDRLEDALILATRDEPRRGAFYARTIGELKYPATVDDARGLLTTDMNIEWLGPSPVMLVLRPGPAGAELVPVARGLLGLLGIQLAAALAGAEFLSLCSACGNPYTPGRRPNPNRARYCPTCRANGAAQRAAARAYRLRKKGANDGEASGK